LDFCLLLCLSRVELVCFFFFFFNDTATTEIYTLSLHDALPIWPLLDRLRDTYEHRSEHVERQRDATGTGEEDREIIEHREIQRTVIDAEREALLRLRADGAIDDDVLRALERELDLEERRIDA